MNHTKQFCTYYYTATVVYASGVILENKQMNEVVLLRACFALHATGVELL